MTGKVEGKDPEPVAWTFGYKGGRVFSTSLGHWDDWKIDAVPHDDDPRDLLDDEQAHPADRRRTGRSG